MTANYVLIDYENVQPDLLPLLDHQQMRVIVFVGAGQKSVPVEFAAAMQRLGSRATYIKLSGNGANALDFHIAYYLGVLAVRDPEAHLHIISKDAGYDPLIQHLRAKNIKAHRFENVGDIPIIKKALPPLSSPASTPESHGRPAAPGSSPTAGVKPTNSNGVKNSAHAPATPNGAAVKSVNGNGAVVVSANGRDRGAVSACSALPSHAMHTIVPANRSNAAPLSSSAAQAASIGGIAPSQLSKDEKIRFVVANLQKHRTARPSRLMTLRNHIHTLFRKQLTESEVEAIIAGLCVKNVISIEEDANQHIAYRLPE